MGVKGISLTAGAVFLASAVAAAAASPVAGVWRAPVNEALIEVYDCGAQTVCGRVLDSGKLRANPDMRNVHDPNPELRGEKVKGMQMMRGFIGGPTRWSGGLLYNPDDGHTYHGAITLVDPHTLKLQGCIIGPLCRTQVWTRAQ